MIVRNLWPVCKRPRRKDASSGTQSFLPKHMLRLGRAASAKYCCCGSVPNNVDPKIEETKEE